MFKRVLLFLAAAFICGTASAQLNLGSILKSSTQQIVERAVESGLVVMRQEYQLEDTTTLQRYTWDNRPEFGSARGFAVITRRGVVARKSLIEPWSGDSRYEKYRGSKYRPVVSNTMIRSVQDSVWRVIGIGSADSLKQFGCSEWHYAQDSIYGKRGFEFDLEKGEKSGWLVMLTASQEEYSDTEPLTIVSYMTKIEVGDEPTCVVEHPTSSRYVIGGVYLNPVYDGFGTMELRIVGMLDIEGEEWRVTLPVEATPTIEEEVVDTGELTLVEGGSNMGEEVETPIVESPAVEEVDTPAVEEVDTPAVEVVEEAIPTDVDEHTAEVEDGEDEEKSETATPEKDRKRRRKRN